VNLKTFKKPYVQRLIIYPIVLVIIGFIVWPKVAAKYFDNGFDLSDTLINKEEIYSGGPIKDGIPALNYPKFISANKAFFLKNNDRVLGLSLNGIAKVYPINIMNHHEIVNDKFADFAVMISYCPLCGTGMAFDANINGKASEFGVSGLLYNSDVLLYDRQTNSLWSQILSQAISGKMKGQKLSLLNLENTTWVDWKNKHPNSLVLSQDTGHNRDYSRSPYVGYDKSQAIYFPIKKTDKRYHPKEWVLGVKYKGITKAYPFSELSQTDGKIHDLIQNTSITITFDAQHQSAIVNNSQGQVIPSTVSYWFAWMAFYPESMVYKAQTD
jgi:hypothetical protein